MGLTTFQTASSGIFRGSCRKSPTQYAINEFYNCKRTSIPLDTDEEQIWVVSTYKVAKLGGNFPSATHSMII